MAFGFQLLNSDDPQEYLFLPFVPTETSWTANSDWAQFLPPGVSGGFVQFSQGGNREPNFELFLNDIGSRSEDKIIGYYTDDTGGKVEISGTNGALEWLERIRSSRITTDGVYKPPAVLSVIIAYRSIGNYVIRGITPRIVQRTPRTTTGFPGPGVPTRAYVGLSMIEASRSPNLNRTVMGW